MSNVMSSFSVLCLVILLMILILKRWKQPYLVAYIAAGVALGPQATAVFADALAIDSLGQIGVVLLLFFIGLEVEIPDNRSLLMQPLIAQAMKTAFSIIVATIAGYLLHWKMGNSLLLATLLLFNSTAVVSDLLRRNGEMHSFMGKIVLNILLLQDVVAGPVFAALQLTGNNAFNWMRLVLAILGCGLVFILLRAIRNRDVLQWSIAATMEDDHDLQVFLGIFICLGFAALATAIGLPAALGSFAAGVYLGRIRAFRWLDQALRPFQVFFVALFFVSIGLRFDARYMGEHWPIVLLFTLGVLLINSVISALCFRLMGHRWSISLQAGALLSQTGEFGLVASAIALKAGIIPGDIYKLCVAVTGLALLLSTAWITILRRMITKRKNQKKPL